MLVAFISAFCHPHCSRARDKNESLMTIRGHRVTTLRMALPAETSVHQDTHASLWIYALDWWAARLMLYVSMGYAPAWLSLRHERQCFIRKLRARNFLLKVCIVAIAPRFLRRGRVVYDEATVKKRGGIAVYWCNGRRCSPLYSVYGWGCFWSLCHCVWFLRGVTELFEVR